MIDHSSEIRNVAFSSSSVSASSADYSRSSSGRFSVAESLSSSAAACSAASASEESFSCDSSCGDSVFSAESAASSCTSTVCTVAPVSAPRAVMFPRGIQVEIDRAVDSINPDMLSVQLPCEHTIIRIMGKETLVPAHAEELHSLTVFMACCSGKKRVRLVGNIFCGPMKTLCG